MLEGLAAVAPERTPSKEKEHAATQIDQEKLQSMLSRLHGLLAHNDGEAMDYLEEIWDELSRLPDQSTLSQLKSSADQFDFDTALESLQQLATTVHISLR